MKHHIINKEEVKCPYRGCNKKYTLLNSFTSHLTKVHRTRHYKTDIIAPDSSEDLNNNNCILESEVPTDPHESQFVNDDVNIQIQEPNLELAGSELLYTDDQWSNLFCDNVAQFYLKLESQYLLPATTIQYIITEISRMHEENEKDILKKLTRTLLAENIAPERIDNI